MESERRIENKIKLRKRKEGSEESEREENGRERQRIMTIKSENYK